MSAEEVKAALLDSFWGTQRGLSAKADVRADINELITQLEAMSPVANPTEVLPLAMFVPAQMPRQHLACVWLGGRHAL